MTQEKEKILIKTEKENRKAERMKELMALGKPAKKSNLGKSKIERIQNKENRDTHMKVATQRQSKKYSVTKKSSSSNSNKSRGASVGKPKSVSKPSTSKTVLSARSPYSARAKPIKVNSGAKRVNIKQQKRKKNCERKRKPTSHHDLLKIDNLFH